MFFNCTTSTHTPAKRHKNLSYLYNDSEAFLHPQYQIYNFSEDSSEIFFSIPDKDLLVKDLGGDYKKYAVIAVHYRLYESLSVSSLLDSATIERKIMVDDDATKKVFSFRIKSPNINKSYLRIQIKDLFSERARRDYLEIDKTRSVNRQSFLISDLKSQNTIFGNELLIKRNYKIESPLFQKHQLFIQEQGLISSIPNLPFSTQRTKAVRFASDTTYLDKRGEIKAEKRGVYFLSFDTSRVKGVALYVYDSIQNYVHTPRQMIEPLSYLLSPKEYQTLLQDSNPKYALDKFWLKIGESTRHAKEMIKVYYRRVSTANKHYSSYKKGWATDRGMIYIIYGEPSKVYKSQTLERWIYGSEESDQSLLFDFAIQKNPFTDNDFELIRDEAYQKSWFQAIDSWRNGRIYSIAR